VPFIARSRISKAAAEEEEEIKNLVLSLHVRGYQVSRSKTKRYIRPAIAETMTAHIRSHPKTNPPFFKDLVKGWEIQLGYQ
jgi:hypothetical protein